MLNVKPSAIIYTGYEYQTMYGVLLLADWLDDPKEYCRINFEADIEDEVILPFLMEVRHRILRLY